jgi:quercetin dioxygenase-like cupin family protein
MKIQIAWLAAMCLLPLPLFAQAPEVAHDVITMDQEPNHRLALQNDFVKVFKVEVSPGDSIILHRHDQDTIATAVGDQEVTVGIPGKPDVHQKNADAQVRLQRGGYMHSTRVDGKTPYHTVAVELLRPQTNFHNLCVEVLPGQPLDCPDVSPRPSAPFNGQPLLESKETRARLVRVLPHQSMNLLGFPASQLIVALDTATISVGPSKQPDEALQPGDFVWIDGGHRRVYQNQSEKETRFIQILFPPAE